MTAVMRSKTSSGVPLPSIVTQESPLSIVVRQRGRLPAVSSSRWRTISGLIVLASAAGQPRYQLLGHRPAIPRPGPAACRVLRRHRVEGLGLAQGARKTVEQIAALAVGLRQAARSTNCSINESGTSLPCDMYWSASRPRSVLSWRALAAACRRSRDAECSRCAISRLDLSAFADPGRTDKNHPHVSSSRRNRAAARSHERAAESASTFFQQARIVPHHQVTVDLLHQVEGDADGDQQAGAAEKAGDLVVDAERCPR